MTLPLLDGASGAVSAAGAVLIGVGFGFALERAGLGSARKIAAQFYLRDLAVFKVMFTAIVTAAVGTVLLSALGVLDLSRVAVPATWLVPQLVGGLIFGAGMIVGGLCPGTSCVAVASGKLDGLAVIGGMAAGSWLFAEAFELLRPLYEATPRGRFTLDQLLGAPYAAVVALVTLVAVAGFILARRIEQRAARPQAE